MFRRRGDNSAKRRRSSPEPGRNGRNYGPSGRKKSVFRPIFSPQVEVEKVLNLLCRHGDIAIAYKTREICSAMSPSISATSTSPRKSLANRRRGKNDEKWVFNLMRNAQSE